MATRRLTARSATSPGEVAPPAHATPPAHAAPPPHLVRNARGSERVFLAVSIRVTVDGADAEKLSAEGETLDVSRHGATISVPCRLRVGQKITIGRLALFPHQAEARVVGEIPDHGANVYGVTFLDPDVNLWDVTFPPIVESDKAVLRTLLRCLSCQRLAVAYLDEFETDLFLVQHNLPRLCSHCGGWTTWTQPYGSLFAGGGELLRPNNSIPGSDRVIAGANRERRSHGRMRLEAVACIRQHDAGHEVVLATDLARGGLSFVSTTKYAPGSPVDVAVPYSSRVPNIFAPARIVSCRSLNGGTFIYGVSFIGK